MTEQDEAESVVEGLTGTDAFTCWRCRHVSWIAMRVHIFACPSCHHEWQLTFNIRGEAMFSLIDRRFR